MRPLRNMAPAFKITVKGPIKKKAICNACAEASIYVAKERTGDKIDIPVVISKAIYVGKEVIDKAWIIEGHHPMYSDLHIGEWNRAVRDYGIILKEIFREINAKVIIECYDSHLNIIKDK